MSFLVTFFKNKQHCSTCVGYLPLLKFSTHMFSLLGLTPSMKQGKFQKIVFLFVTCETVTKLCRQILPFSMLTQVCILMGQMPSVIVNMAKHNYIMSLGHQGWAGCGAVHRSTREGG